MIKRALVVLSVLGSTVPQALEAQGLGFGAFAGTLGVGGEVAVGVTDRIALRGGFGVMPFEPGVTFNDIDLTLTLPSSYHAGVDVYLNNAMRIGAGVLWRTDDPELEGVFDSPQEIGGTTFTPAEIGKLTGVLDAKNRAPYVLVGFGRHTEPGVALFIDIGVAFVGDPNVRLSTIGGTLSPDAEPLQSALEREAQSFEDDVRGYLTFWPFLNLGVRVGIE